MPLGRTGRDDNIEVFGIELLTPNQARAIVFGTLVNDLIGVLGDGLDLD